jgi:hypothetical protein
VELNYSIFVSAGKGFFEEGHKFGRPIELGIYIFCLDGVEIGIILGVNIHLHDNYVLFVGELSYLIILEVGADVNGLFFGREEVGGSEN